MLLLPLACGALVIIGFGEGVLWKRFVSAALCAIGIGLLIVGSLPSLFQIWWLVLLLALACGTLVTLGCGGAVLWKRFVSATICGIVIGLLYTAVCPIAGYAAELSLGDFAKRCAYVIFVFAICSTLGAIVTELKLRDPEC
jgi:hypothetical protein